MRTLQLVMMLLAVLGLAESSALASAVNVTFCATYKVAYDDSDLVNPDDEAQEGDYFFSNANKTARGARIKTIRHSDGATQQLFAAWDGTDAGCAGPFQMDDAIEFDVQIHSIAEVNSNTVKVMNDQDDLQVWFSVALDDWTPPAGGGTVNIETANTHDAWNVAAAAGHALWRRNGSVTNKTYDFFTVYDMDGANADPCGNGSGSCHRSGDVHLSTEGVNRRFIIVHEMGHALGFFAANSTSAGSDYGAGVNNCFTVSSRDHEMNSKEWQSAAIKEGWAHFYAAVAFNQTNELNCGFVYYKSQDYDLDFTAESADPHTFSCEAGPSFTCSGCVDAKDYLGDMCTGTLTGRGTEMDWLRFWWDFLSEETATVSFGDCTDIYATAVLGTYDSPAAAAWDSTPEVGTPTADRPYIHMEEAATFLGLSTEWAAHTDNGITR